MRMTESRLREVIRKLIIENVINQKNYTFEFGANWEVKKVRELEGAQIVSVKESSDPDDDIILLLVGIPSKNGDMGVILFTSAGDQDQSVDEPYLEDGDSTGAIIPKPFNDVKKEFERQTKGGELFKSVSQRSMEKIKYFRENRVMWDKFSNKAPEDQARADFYMMYLRKREEEGFDEIKDTQEEFYSDWQNADEFLEVIIGVDGKYDKDFADFLKGKYN